jgi:hypothetical protein
MPDNLAKFNAEVAVGEKLIFCCFFSIKDDQQKKNLIAIDCQQKHVKAKNCQL